MFKRKGKKKHELGRQEDLDLRTEMQPTAVSLPGESHGHTSLASPVHGVTELNMTERLTPRHTIRAS